MSPTCVRVAQVKNPLHHPEVQDTVYSKVINFYGSLQWMQVDT